ncbi:MAG: hypothetical protein WCK77_25455 [Verrucomicrobiota bacterium]
MKRKIPAIAILFAILGTTCGIFANVPPGEGLPSNVGRLGVPVKSEVTIEVEVVRAEDANHKKMVGDYLLRVVKVTNQWHFAVMWRDGQAEFNARIIANAIDGDLSDPFWIMFLSLATKLGAEISGEEGEIYDTTTVKAK